jgi:hypothetical protein
VLVVLAPAGAASAAGGVPGTGPGGSVDPGRTPAGAPTAGAPAVDADGACESGFAARSGRLRGEADAASHTFTVDADCAAVLRVDARGDADVDAYVTHDGRRPSRTDYDDRSVMYGNREAVEFEAGAHDRVAVTVRSADGAANYSVTLAQYDPTRGFGWEDVDSVEDLWGHLESALTTAERTYQNWTEEYYWNGAKYGEEGRVEGYEGAGTAEYALGHLSAGFAPVYEVWIDYKDCTTWTNETFWNYADCAFLGLSATTTAVAAVTLVGSGGTSSGLTWLDADPAKAASTARRYLDDGLRDTAEAEQLGRGLGRMFEPERVEQVLEATDDAATERAVRRGLEDGARTRQLTSLEEAGLDAATRRALRERGRLETAAALVEETGRAGATLLGRLDHDAAARLLAVEGPGADALRATVARESRWAATAGRLDDGTLRLAVPDGRDALPAAARRLVRETDDLAVRPVVDGAGGAAGDAGRAGELAIDAEDSLLDAADVATRHLRAHPEDAEATGEALARQFDSPGEVVTIVDDRIDDAELVQAFRRGVHGRQLADLENARLVDAGGDAGRFFRRSVLREATPDRADELVRAVEMVGRDAGRSASERSARIGEVVDDLYPQVGTEGFRELSPEHARQVAHGLARVDRAGEVRVPRGAEEFAVRVPTDGDELDEMGTAYADYWFVNGQVRIHPYNLDRSKMADGMESGWVVGDPEVVPPVERTFVHEWGHVRHHQRLTSPDTPDDLWIAPEEGYSGTGRVADRELSEETTAAAEDQIGEYATTTKYEFVAERYTQKMLDAGDVDYELEVIYREELYGPRVEESASP